MTSSSENEVGPADSNQGPDEAPDAVEGEPGWTAKPSDPGGDESDGD